MNAPVCVSTLEELATPALVIDAVVARNNIRRLADYTSKHRIGLRPHTKTHKNRVIAKLQIEAGAIGLTVTKAGEAEQLQTETNDLLMAYPAVDRARCERLAELAKTKTIRVIADSAIGVEALSSAAKNAGCTIGVLVEIDVGMGRTGVGTAQDSLVLAQSISKT